MRKWIAKQKEKAKLIKCFQEAEIGKWYKYGKEKIFIHPKIHHIKIEAKRKTFVFTLLDGIDPKELARKEYVFKQVFGPLIQMEGDVKKFVLKVFSEEIKQFDYNFEELHPKIKRMKLPIICGKNILGEYIYYDMVKENRNNILIAGEPGAGKSTQIRQIITTLVKVLPPEKLKLYLADLKLSEFHLFRNIKHVENIYETPEDLAPALKKLDGEIKRRGKLLKEHGVTHVDKIKGESVPYIILCIDEYSLLADDEEINKVVNRIGALGRALGMFIIISMQRPSHDLIPTKTRALLSTRMGFRVADMTNAKIIGTPGAEALTTEGRMMLKIEKLEEVQAPLLEENEAEKLLLPFKMTKKEIEEKEVMEEDEKQPEQLSEEDIFNDMKGEQHE